MVYHLFTVTIIKDKNKKSNRKNKIFYVNVFIYFYGCVNGYIGRGGEYEFFFELDEKSGRAGSQNTVCPIFKL